MLSYPLCNVRLFVSPVHRGDFKTERSRKLNVDQKAASTLWSSFNSARLKVNTIIIVTYEWWTILLTLSRGDELYCIGGDWVFVPRTIRWHTIYFMMYGVLGH